MSERTIGQIIDGLEVGDTLTPGDLVASAIVITEVIDEDGDTRLSVAWSEGLSFLKRAGMLHYAFAMETEA